MLDQLFAQAKEFRQQAFEAGTVSGFDAHTGIEREATAVFPLTHGLRVLVVEQAAPGQRAQQTAAHPGLYFAQRAGPISRAS